MLSLKIRSVCKMHAKNFMSMISDCSTITNCEKCNASDDEIKCLKCKAGFSLMDNNCEGITNKVCFQINFKLNFKLTLYVYSCIFWKHSASFKIDFVLMQVIQKIVFSLY